MKSGKRWFVFGIVTLLCFETLAADMSLGGGEPESRLVDIETLEMQGTLSKPMPGEGHASVFSGSMSGEVTSEIIEWDTDWPYASYSQIHTGSAVLYRIEGGNSFTICVNAGHGTAGGESVMTLCHPDGTPKVTGGSTAEGAVYAIAVSSGTTMLDGTAEGKVNLQMAVILKEKLLDAGFNVLMIRESDDVQLDNIARTVMANENADCHLAIHYDSTTSDKGFFYMSVPMTASYLAMEPVASHYQQHNALGNAIFQGVVSAGNPVYEYCPIEMDLTQTSYSTIPSVDVECGDRASDWSVPAQTKIAEGIVEGLKAFFGV